MQTFIVHRDLEKSAELLDRQRLGKQRLECVQIAKACLGISKGWKNHPNVLRWKGYEPFIVSEYLHSILYEWERRGYKNDKMRIEFFNLLQAVESQPIIKPFWINDKLIIQHRDLLLSKDFKFYKIGCQKTQRSSVFGMNDYPCSRIYFLTVSLLTSPTVDTKYPSDQKVFFLQNCVSK